MLSRISRNQWLNILLAAAFAIGIGMYLYRKYHKEEIPTRPPLPEVEPIPIEVDAEGWRLKTDCTLVMEPQPIVRISPLGKFIDTPAVGLVPSNRSDWTYQIRPRTGGDEKAIVRLHYNRIPLKASKQIPSWGDELLLTENDKTGVAVTTLLIKSGTVILPPQSGEVIDRFGKVVMRHPSE